MNSIDIIRKEYKKQITNVDGSLTGDANNIKWGIVNTLSELIYAKGMYDDIEILSQAIAYIFELTSKDFVSLTVDKDNYFKGFCTSKIRDTFFSDLESIKRIVKIQNILNENN